MQFSFSALCALPLFANSAYGAVRFRHEAIRVQRQQQPQRLAQATEDEALHKRQLLIPSIPSGLVENIATMAVEEAAPSVAIITSTPTSTVFSYYYPSPSAFPTPITQQSQVETTYVPRITTCKGPLVALEVIEQTISPFLNYTSTIYADGPVTCDTLYYTEITTICATTLTGVASKVTISECTQDVTFSSAFGVTTVTPHSTATDVDGNRLRITAAPSIQLRTTYYLAPWQSFTANAGALPEDVDVKVCHQRPENETMEDCIRREESWIVIPVTLTSTYTSSVDLLATLTEGPGEYVVGTIRGQFVGNATVVSLSTEMVLNYAYEAQTVSRAPRVGSFATGLVAAATPEDAPATVTELSGSPGALRTITSTRTTTRTRTRTVELASSTETEDEVTTVLTESFTTTIYSGTSTVYDKEEMAATGYSFVMEFLSGNQPSSLRNDDPFAFATPSAAILFAESYTMTPEVAIPNTLGSGFSADTASTTPNFLFESPVTTSGPTMGDKILPWSSETEAPISDPRLVNLAFPLPFEQLSSVSEAPTASWIPEFVPVTESPSLEASPVLVPSPALLQHVQSPPLPEVYSLDSQPSHSTAEVVVSATPVPSSPFPIRWFNTTTPRFQ